MFIDEDGTGKVDSNSFCSVEFADEYFSIRGISEWAGTPEIKQGALIQATDYIEISFEFKGSKKSAAQALSFPRSGMLEAGEYPSRLLKACAEYALRALSGPLYVDPTYHESGRIVTGESSGLKSLKDSVTYSEYQTINKRSYPAADKLIEPLVLNNGSVTFMTR